MLDNRQPNGSRSAQNSAAPNKELPSLTSLRGLAALWVVFYHYSVQCFPNLDAAAPTHLIHKGYLAVDMFFMLSGFVMTHVYYRTFSDPAGVTRHYGSFLVARFARVYPLHLLILLLFVATALASQLTAATPAEALRDIPLQGPESLSAFFANVFMLQGLDASKLSWNYPAWSISVEFMAYLLFPFALPAIWRASARGQITVAISLLAMLGLFAFLSKGNFDQWDGPITLLRCMPEFILGTLLYSAFRAAPKNTLLERDIAAFGILAAVVICLHVDAPDLLITCLFAALLLAAVLNAGSFSKIANATLLIWLGQISYSLYLLHGFVQFITTKLLTSFGVGNHAELSIHSSLVLMILMVGVCLLAAHLTYFSVEIGCRRYLRNLFGAWGRKPSAAPAIGSSQTVPAQQRTS